MGWWSSTAVCPEVTDSLRTGCGPVPSLPAHISPSVESKSPITYKIPGQHSSSSQKNKDNPERCIAQAVLCPPLRFILRWGFHILLLFGLHHGHLTKQKTNDQASSSICHLLITSKPSIIYYVPLHLSMHSLVVYLQIPETLPHAFTSKTTPKIQLEFIQFLLRQGLS